MKLLCDWNTHFIMVNTIKLYWHFKMIYTLTYTYFYSRKIWVRLFFKTKYFGTFHYKGINL